MHYEDYEKSSSEMRKASDNFDKWLVKKMLALAVGKTKSDKEDREKMLALSEAELIANEHQLGKYFLGDL